jgi:hypothetical protein
MARSSGLKSTYKRHGTLNLFAALEVATGQVKTAITQLKRREEFLQFMGQVVAESPAEQELHVILDNYCTPGCSSIRTLIIDRDTQLASHWSHPLGVGHGDQSTEPTQQGVWSDGSGDLAKASSADELGFASKPDSLSIGKALGFAAQLFEENPILSLQELGQMIQVFRG